MNWPVLMTAETAASYLDFPSAAAFRKAVRRGVYPPPINRKGERPKWRRDELDRSAKLAATEGAEGLTR
jgi:hypothetical protein